MNESDVIDMILSPLSEDDWPYIRDMGIDHIYPSGMTALGLAVDYLKEESVFFLLEKGADPNVFGNGMTSPLWDAYISSEPKMFIALLMYGANPNLGGKDNQGNYSLYSPRSDMKDAGIADFMDFLFSSYKPTR